MIAPTAIVAAFMETPLLFLRHLGFTLLMTSIGFGLSVGLGVALAVGIVYSRLLERTVYTLLVALNSIPKVALAPLFVIWMGTGPEPKIAIALMLGIFPIVIETVSRRATSARPAMRSRKTRRDATAREPSLPSSTA